MEYKLLKLKNESIERKQRKVDGDTVNALKYNKMSAKFVIFISGINHLFYYDETISKNNKSEPKCIVIRDITISNNSIETQRKVLFITGSISIRHKWFEFINNSSKHKQKHLKIKTQIETIKINHKINTFSLNQIEIGKNINKFESNKYRVKIVDMFVMCS